LPPDSSANSAPSPDWDAIAHDYAESDLTVSEICALYSISCSVLYDRAELDGWIKRSAARRAARDRRPSPPPGGAKATDLARRMLTALDHKMTEFETRMTQATAGAAPITAADSERDARTLNTLVRLFDKLKGFGAKAPSSARAAAASRTGGKDIHDADRYRNDLARRLERLRDGIGG
jgi:hypothetical protein